MHWKTLSPREQALCTVVVSTATEPARRLLLTRLSGCLRSSLYVVRLPGRLDDSYEPDRSKRHVTWQQALIKTSAAANDLLIEWWNTHYVDDGNSLLGTGCSIGDHRRQSVVNGARNRLSSHDYLRNHCSTSVVMLIKPDSPVRITVSNIEPPTC